MISNEGVVRLRRRPNNAAIIRAFPKYSDRHDGAYLYAMQYLILNKPFRQWNEFAEGFGSPFAHTKLLSVTILLIPMLMTLNST